MDRSLGYMVVPFLRGVTDFGHPAGSQKEIFYFLTHLQQLKGYLAFTDLIMNQSIGVVEGVLHTLV